MMSSHRNTPLRAWALLTLGAAAAVATSACTSKKDVQAARKSQYDADFAVVYSAALEAVRETYPQLADNPAKGTIKTAWHQVQYNTSGVDDPKSQQNADRAVGLDSQGRSQSSLSGNTSLSRKRYFIRFDVAVAGGRPWRVRVTGHASEWEPGNAVPSELRGPAVPHWLAGRTDALVVDVYKRLQQYAIVVPDQVIEEEQPAPIDSAAYGPIPPGAGNTVGLVQRALAQRDYDTLRATLAPDVVWSFGGDPGVDAAMAGWQADPSALEAMGAVIRKGCRVDGPEVACPPEAAEGAGYLDWRLRLGQRGGVWKVVAFVAGD